MRLGDPSLLVCLRERERRQVKAAGELERVESVSWWPIDRKQLTLGGQDLVMMFRPSMLEELERAGALREALAIWSM